jgi:hypothetical protein
MQRNPKKKTQTQKGKSQSTKTFTPIQVQNPYRRPNSSNAPKTPCDQDATKVAAAWAFSPYNK